MCKICVFKSSKAFSKYNRLPTVFHYQVKVHFFGKTKLSYTDQPMKISLYGTDNEKENIPYVM